MAKTSGLGDDFLAGGYHIGGDIQALTLHGGPNLLDVTDITQSAHSRLGGLRDGAFDITAYFDPSAGQAHAAFSGLPTTDVIMTYLRGQAIGNPSLCQNSKQVGYDPTRAADGSLTLKVAGNANSYGQEWGLQLTNGVRTDTTATNGTSLDNGAGTTNGAQAYLQAVSLTGSTVTVTVQHSTDNASWSTLAAFTAYTSAPAAQRITAAGTVNRYLRVITAGTFTATSFQVTVVRNIVSVVF